MLKTIICLCWFLCSTTAYSYTILFMTDDPSQSKAMEWMEWLKTTRPFNNFKINYRVEYNEMLKHYCGTGQFERLTMCDRNFLDERYRQLLQENPASAHRIIVVTEKGKGGAAYLNRAAVVSTKASKYVMLHELIHTYGFADEYIYRTDEERKTYCYEAAIKKAKNLTIIPDDLGPFDSDEAARNAVRDYVPWIDEVNIPITHLNYNGDIVLESDKFNNTGLDKIGLYEYRQCSGYVKGKVFKMVGVTTIMKDAKVPLGPAYEKIIEKTLLSEGAIRL